MSRKDYITNNNIINQCYSDTKIRLEALEEFQDNTKVFSRGDYRDVMNDYPELLGRTWRSYEEYVYDCTVAIKKLNENFKNLCSLKVDDVPLFENSNRFINSLDEKSNRILSCLRNQENCLHDRNRERAFEEIVDERRRARLDDFIDDVKRANNMLCNELNQENEQRERDRIAEEERQKVGQEEKNKENKNKNNKNQNNQNKKENEEDSKVITLQSLKDNLNEQSLAVEDLRKKYSSDLNDKEYEQFIKEYRNALFNYHIDVVNAIILCQEIEVQNAVRQDRKLSIVCDKVKKDLKELNIELLCKKEIINRGYPRENIEKMFGEELYDYQIGGLDVLSQRVREELSVDIDNIVFNQYRFKDKEKEAKSRLEAVNPDINLKHLNEFLKRLGAEPIMENNEPKPVDRFYDAYQIAKSMTEQENSEENKKNEAEAVKEEKISKENVEDPNKEQNKSNEKNMQKQAKEDESKLVGEAESNLEEEWFYNDWNLGLSKNNALEKRFRDSNASIIRAEAILKDSFSSEEEKKKAQEDLEKATEERETILLESANEYRQNHMPEEEKKAREEQRERVVKHDPVQKESSTAKTKTPKGKTGNRNKKKQTNSKVSKKQEQTTSANEISETSTEETVVERVPLDEIKKKKQELLNEKNNSILEPVVKEEKANEEKNNVAVSQDLESGASVQKVPLAEIKKVQEENGLTETTVQQNKEKDIVSNVQKEKKGMDFSPKFHSLREGVTFILDAYTQDYKLGDGDIEAYKADMKEMLEYGITQTELKNFEEVSEFDIDETIENYLKAKQIGKNSDNLEMGEDS